MKKSTLIVILFWLAAALMGSCKKENGQTVTLIRDCTGTYLRWNEKDYQVCNLEKVSAFPDGSILSAAFKRIPTCKGSAANAIVCHMLHANEGWIEVIEIK